MTDPTMRLSPGREYLVSAAPYWNSSDPANPTPPKPLRVILLTRHRWNHRKATSRHTERVHHERLGTFEVPGHLAPRGNQLAVYTNTGETILVPRAHIRGEWEPAYRQWCTARAEHTRRTFDGVQEVADRGAQALAAHRALLRFGVNAQCDVMTGRLSITSADANRLAELLSRILPG